MLKQLRKNIIQNLWDNYRNTSPDMQLIETGLINRNSHSYLLDHFAIIDLPGPRSGIPQLKQLFSILGFVEQGGDYLADKQNDFIWMTEIDSHTSIATDVLPQVVAADFRLNEMPPEIRNIIEKYSRLTQPLPLTAMQSLINRVCANETQALNQCTELVLRYLSGRDWPLPSSAEFHAVREFNELLAWVLIFGRRPNHFTLSIHLLNTFNNLADFHRFIQHDVKLELNQEGGIIKGGRSIGIEQGSTIGISQSIQLADGTVQLPTGFVEFVWRFPTSQIQQPLLWRDYFTGFIAQHANHVIESLYTGTAVSC